MTMEKQNTSAATIYKENFKLKVRFMNHRSHEWELGTLTPQNMLNF